VAKRFVNLNRFKHGWAIKRSGKQKPDLQDKKKSESGKPQAY
jgi:hypothetical protein